MVCNVPTYMRPKCDIAATSYAEQGVTQPSLINLHLNKYTQGLRYYTLAVDLDRSMRSCNTLNDLSNRVCVPVKTEDLNLNVFNMIRIIKH